MRRLVSPAGFPLFGVHAGKCILCAAACPRCSFFKSGFLPKCYGRDKRVESAFFGILGGTFTLTVYRYLRVPGWFFCGSFLMVSAGWLAWLTGWLGWLAGRLAGWLGHRLGGWPAGWGRVFLVAPGLWTSLGCASEGGFCCYLRVPGDLRAYRVRLGIQILSLCWVPRG